MVAATIKQPAPGSHLDGGGKGKGKASTYAEDSSNGNGNGNGNARATTGMDYGIDLSSMADWVPDPSLWDKIGGTGSTADPTSAGTFNLADPVKTIEVRAGAGASYACLCMNARPRNMLILDVAETRTSGSSSQLSSPSKVS